MGSAYLAPSFCTVLALIQGPEVAYPGGTGGPMSTLPSPQSKTAAAPASRRSRVKRVPDRGHYDAATIHAILDAAWLCHVGFIQDGQPVVIPTACWREGEHLYIHGRSEEHTSELQSLMRNSSAVFCLQKKNNIYDNHYMNIILS